MFFSDLQTSCCHLTSFFLLFRGIVKKTCQTAMIHYLKNKVGVVDFANAQGVVMF